MDLWRYWIYGNDVKIKDNEWRVWPAAWHVVNTSLVAAVIIVIIRFSVFPKLSDYVKASFPDMNKILEVRNGSQPSSL
jgi:hypothetical protein